MFGNLCTSDLNESSSVRRDICVQTSGAWGLRFQASGGAIWLMNCVSDFTSCWDVNTSWVAAVNTRGVCPSHGRVVLLGLCYTHTHTRTWNLAHTVTLHNASWPHAGPLFVGRNEKCVDLLSAESLPLLDIKTHVLSKYCVVRRLERG